MKMASNKAFQVTAHKASPNLNADVHMAEGTSRGQSSPVFHIQSFFGSGI
jgi:hypothetical protein